MPAELPYRASPLSLVDPYLRAPSAWVGERLDYWRTGDPIEPVWPKLLTPGREPTLAGRDVITPALGGHDFDLVDMLLAPYHYPRIGLQGALRAGQRLLQGDLRGMASEGLRTLGEEFDFAHRQAAFTAGLVADMALDPVMWTIPFERAARLGADAASRLIPRAVQRPGALVEELAGREARGAFQRGLTEDLQGVLRETAPEEIVQRQGAALERVTQAIDARLGAVTEDLAPEIRDLIRAETMQSLGDTWGTAWYYRLGRAGGPLDIRLTGRSPRTVPQMIGGDPLLSAQARSALGEVDGARYAARIMVGREELGEQMTRSATDIRTTQRAASTTADAEYRAASRELDAARAARTSQLPADQARFSAAQERWQAARTARDEARAALERPLPPSGKPTSTQIRQMVQWAWDEAGGAEAAARVGAELSPSADERFASLLASELQYWDIRPPVGVPGGFAAAGGIDPIGTLRPSAAAPSVGRITAPLEAGPYRDLPLLGDELELGVLALSERLDPEMPARLLRWGERTREEIAARMPSAVQRAIDMAERDLRGPAVRYSKALSMQLVPETPGIEAMSLTTDALIAGERARLARQLAGLRGTELELREEIRRSAGERLRQGAAAAGAEFSAEDAMNPPEVQPRSRHPEADRIAAERTTQEPSVAPQQAPQAAPSAEVAPTPTEVPQEPTAAPTAAPEQAAAPEEEAAVPQGPTGVSIMEALASAYPKPIHIDSVVAATGLPIGRVSAELMTALLEGQVEVRGPQRYILRQAPPDAMARAAERQAEELAAQEQAQATAARVTSEAAGTPEQQAIMQALSGGEPVNIDDIVEATGLAAHQVSSNLMLMEIAGQAKRLPGNFYQAAGEQAVSEGPAEAEVAAPTPAVSEPEAAVGPEVAEEPEVLSSEVPQMAGAYMEQVRAIKAEHGEDVLVGLRMGDFLEFFGPDAETTAQELDLTLTSRSTREGRVPMTGVPYYEIDKYLRKLIDKGYRVAVGEQKEEAAGPEAATPVARPIVDRVQQVVVDALRSIGGRGTEADIVGAVVRAHPAYGVDMVHKALNALGIRQLVDYRGGTYRLAAELAEAAAPDPEAPAPAAEVEAEPAAEEAAPAERDYVTEVRDLQREQTDLMFQSGELDEELDDLIQAFKPVTRYDSESQADLARAEGHLVRYMPDGRWYRFAKAAGRSPSEEDMQAMRDVVARRDDIESQRTRLSEQVSGTIDEAWAQGIDARSEIARQEQLRSEALAAEQREQTERAVQRLRKESGGQIMHLRDFEQEFPRATVIAERLGFRIVTGQGRAGMVLIPSTQLEREAARMRWPQHYDAALKVDELKWLSDAASRDTDDAARDIGMPDDLAYVERLLRSDIAQELGFRLDGDTILHPATVRWPTEAQALRQASLFDPSWQPGEAAAPPQSQGTAPAAATSAPEAPSGAEAQPTTAQPTEAAQRVAAPAPERPAPAAPAAPTTAPQAQAEQAARTQAAARRDEANARFTTTVHDLHETQERIAALEAASAAMETKAGEVAEEMAKAVKEGIRTSKAQDIEQVATRIKRWMESWSFFPGWEARHAQDGGIIWDRTEDAQSRVREPAAHIFSRFVKADQRFIGLMMAARLHKLREDFALGDGIVIPAGTEVAPTEDAIVRAFWAQLRLEPTDADVAGGYSSLPQHGKDMWDAVDQGLEFLRMLHTGRGPDGTRVTGYRSLKELSDELERMTGTTVYGVSYLDYYWPKPRVVRDIPRYLVDQYKLLISSGVPEDKARAIIENVEDLRAQEDITFRATYESSAIRYAELAAKMVEQGGVLSADDAVLFAELDPVKATQWYARKYARVGLVHDIFRFVQAEFPTIEEILAERGPEGLATLEAAGWRPLSSVGEPLEGMEQYLMPPQYARVLETMLISQLGPQEMMEEPIQSITEALRHAIRIPQVGVLISRAFLVAQQMEYVFRIILQFGTALVSREHALALNAASRVLARDLLEQTKLVPPRPVSYARTALATAAMGTLGYGLGSLVDPGMAQALGITLAGSTAVSPFALRFRVLMARAVEASAGALLGRHGMSNEKIKQYTEEAVRNAIVTVGFGAQSTEQFVHLLPAATISAEDLMILAASRALLGESAQRTAAEIGHQLDLTTAEARELAEAVSEMFFGMDNLHRLTAYIMYRERGYTEEAASRAVRANTATYSVGASGPVLQFLKSWMWFATFSWQTGKQLARETTRRPGQALALAELYRRRNEYLGFDAEAGEHQGGRDSWMLTSPEWLPVRWGNEIFPEGSGPSALVLKHKGPATAFVRLRIVPIEEVGVWGQAVLDPIAAGIDQMVPTLQVPMNISQDRGSPNMARQTPMLSRFVSKARRVAGKPWELGSPAAQVALGRQVPNEAFYRYVEYDRTAQKAQEIDGNAWKAWRDNRLCPTDCQANYSLWRDHPEEAAQLEVDLMRLYYNAELVQNVYGLSVNIQWGRQMLQQMNLGQLVRAQAEADAKLEAGVTPWIQPRGPYDYTYQAEIDQRLQRISQGRPGTPGMPITWYDQTRALGARMSDYRWPASWATGRPDQPMTGTEGR